MWTEVRDGLRRIGPTVAVDLIGHGRSPKPTELAPYGMEACLAQLDAVLERLEVPRAWWVGYSLGGRAALQMAVHKPERVAGLVLASTTAGFPDPAVRAERVRADQALAERITRWELAEFVDFWLDQPTFESLRRLPRHKLLEQRRMRLENSPHALANALRGLGSGAMLPVWAHLRDVDVPALVMAGELDEQYAALARSMAAALPQANLSILPDAGHALVTEVPQKFLNAVVGFFTRLKAA